MSAEILIPCGQCGADVGVILGFGTLEEVGPLACSRCEMGLPPLPPLPLASHPPPPAPHACPRTALRIHLTGWRCVDCEQTFAPHEVAAAATGAA